MAKTKPIGVRFNQEILDELKEHRGLNSPQSVLSFLENLYLDISRPKNPTSDLAKAVAKISMKNVGAVLAKEAERPPQRMVGENSLDYQIRLEEWYDNRK